MADMCTRLCWQYIDRANEDYSGLFDRVMKRANDYRGIPSHMNIRQASSEDIEAIRHIAKSSWELDYPDILTRETIKQGVEEWYNPERIESELNREDTLLLVAESDDDVIGFAHAVRTRRRGHILRVYVAPEHRQEGSGSELLANTRDTLITRGVDNIQAMVLAANNPGNAFYETFGFEKVDEEETVIGGETYTENVYERKR